MAEAEVPFEQGPGWGKQAKAVMEFDRDNTESIKSDGVRFELRPSGLVVMASSSKAAEKWAAKVRKALKIS